MDLFIGFFFLSMIILAVFVGGRFMGGAGKRNRNALTEMGEDYQTYASMILVLQAQSDDNSQ